MLRKSELAVCSCVPGAKASSSAACMSLSPSTVSRCFRMRTSAGWSAAKDSLACVCAGQHSETMMGSGFTVRGGNYDGVRVHSKGGNHVLQHYQGRAY